MPLDGIPTIWPFVELIGNDLFGATYTVLEPSAVPWSMAYPGTDRVLRREADEETGDCHVLLDIDGQRGLALASVCDPISTVFSPGLLVAAYPLEQGISVTRPYCATSVSPTSLTPYCGEVEMLFVGSGLLQLPFGEFDDARLVRTRQTKVDQGDPSDSTITETLSWFARGMAYPLLQFVTLNYANGSRTRSGWILDETSVVGFQERTTTQKCRAYPVPSDGEVFLDLPGGGELEVITMDGRTIYRASIPSSATTVQLDLGAYPPGSYHAILRHQGVVEHLVLILE